MALELRIAREENWYFRAKGAPKILPKYDNASFLGTPLRVLLETPNRGYYRRHPGLGEGCSDQWLLAV